MEILKNPDYDFLGKTQYFVAASLLLIAAGSRHARPGRLRYGVEFSGGTQLIVKFKNAPEIDKIRAAVEKVSPGRRDPDLRRPRRNQVLIRLARRSRVSRTPTPTSSRGAQGA